MTQCRLGLPEGAAEKSRLTARSRLLLWPLTFIKSSRGFWPEDAAATAGEATRKAKVPNPAPGENRSGGR